jgi:hypothetical protein
MKVQERLLLGISAVVMALLVAGAVIAGLYWLTGVAGPDGVRWWAVVATLAIPAVVIVTYRLATHAAREHLSGFDRGLTGAQKTVETMGRSLAATASLARTSARPAQLRPIDDDLLPRVGAMHLIESQQDTDGMVDL